MLDKKWILRLTGGCDEGDQLHRHSETNGSNSDGVESKPFGIEQRRSYLGINDCGVVGKTSRRKSDGAPTSMAEEIRQNSSWILSLTRRTTSAMLSVDDQGNNGTSPDAIKPNQSVGNVSKKLNIGGKIEGGEERFGGSARTMIEEDGVRYQLPPKTEASDADRGRGDGNGNGTARLRSMLMSQSDSSPISGYSSEFELGGADEENRASLEWGLSSIVDSMGNLSDLATRSTDTESANSVPLAMTPMAFLQEAGRRSSGTSSSNRQRQEPPLSYRLRATNDTLKSSRSEEFVTPETGDKDQQGRNHRRSSIHSTEALALPGAYNVEGIGGIDIPPTTGLELPSSTPTQGLPIVSNATGSHTGAFALYPQESAGSTLSGNSNSLLPSWLESSTTINQDEHARTSTSPSIPSAVPSSNYTSNKWWWVVATLLVTTILVMAIVILVSFVVTAGVVNQRNTNSDNDKNMSPSGMKMKQFQSIIEESMKIVDRNWNATKLLIDDVNSPQYKAFHWLLNEPYEICVGDDYGNNNEGCDDGSDEDDMLPSYKYRVLQRYSLAVLYYSTNGSTQWLDSFQFLSPIHECDWTSSIRTNIALSAGEPTRRGVICSYEANELNYDDGGHGAKSVDGTSSTIRSHRGNKDKKVSGLVMGKSVNRLFGFFSSFHVLLKAVVYCLSKYLIPLFTDMNNLGGTIPKEIHVLTNLEVLVLHRNSLTGLLPAAMSRLTSLSTLDLSENHLQGTVPGHLGKLSNLKILRLGHNKFYGDSIRTIADHIYGLREMNVTNNAGMNGEILSFSQLRRTKVVGRTRELEVLDMRNCSFSGQLTSRFFSEMENLKVFRADDNDFVGTLSVVTTTGRSLEWEKEDELVSEIFPNYANALKWGLKDTLSILTLSRNQLSGTFPWVELANINAAENFIQIDVSENQLTGTLPVIDDIYSKFSNLVYLDMSFNQFDSRIPENIGEMNALKVLELQGNQFTGSLPSNLSTLQSLRVLDVSENELQGTIPAELGSCTSLEHLALHGNGFSGTIPTDLLNLSSLRK